MSDNSSTDSINNEFIEAFKDARWPMTKDELIEWANKSHARSQVIDAINAMSYDKFYTIDDVTRDYAND